MRKAYLLYEGLSLRTVKTRPAGSAVITPHAGEHVERLNRGDRQRPGREHAYCEQLTLVGLRVGGRRSDNLHVVMRRPGACSPLNTSFKSYNSLFIIVLFTNLLFVSSRFTTFTDGISLPRIWRQPCKNNLIRP